MKKLSLILGLILPFFVFGQKLSDDFTVTTSTPFPVVDANSKEYVYMDNGFVVSVKTDGDKSVIIQKFNVDGMKEVKRKEYEDLPKYAKVQSLLKVGGKLFYVFEAYNKKEKTFTVYSREVDVANVAFKAQKELFTSSRPVVAPRTINIMNFNLWGGGNQTPKFEVITSFDQSKILIRYRNEPEIKSDDKNHDELGFYVFDNSFTKIWGREVKMPHTEKEMNNLAYTVDKNGVVYMLDRLNETKSFEVIMVTKDKLVNKKLPVKDGLIFDKFDLRVNDKGNVLAAGYYATGTDVKVSWTGDMSTSKNINGLYVFEFNKEGEIVKENDYEFPLELIQQNLSDRNAKKAADREEDGNAGINDLQLREFIVNKDGSIVVIGEVYYSRKEMWMMSMDFVTHYGDIVITKINPDGSLAWMDKLAKNQASLTEDIQNVGGLGIAHAVGENAYYILFADNRANAELALDEPAEPHKGGFGGYLTAYKVDDATGKVEKHLILDLTDIKGIRAYQFYVSRIMEAGEKTFLLEAYIKGKEDSMIKMKLK